MGWCMILNTDRIMFIIRVIEYIISIIYEKNFLIYKIDYVKY